MVGTGLLVAPVSGSPDVALAEGVLFGTLDSSGDAKVDEAD